MLQVKHFSAKYKQKNKKELGAQLGSTYRCSLNNTQKTWQPLLASQIQKEHGGVTGGKLVETLTA